MCIRLIFVQRPNRSRCVVPTPDRDRPIHDDRYPHVWVGLDAEGKDGDANEEHGYHSHDLGTKKPKEGRKNWSV